MQAGILSEADAPARDLAAAITHDTTLTEAQRRTLLEIYRAFQAENRNSEDTPRDPRKESA